MAIVQGMPYVHASAMPGMGAPVNRASKVFELMGIPDGTRSSTWHCICAFAVWVKPSSGGSPPFPQSLMLDWPS